MDRTGILSEINDRTANLSAVNRHVRKLQVYDSTAESDVKICAFGAASGNTQLNSPQPEVSMEVFCLLGIQADNQLFGLLKVTCHVTQMLGGRI